MNNGNLHRWRFERDFTMVGNKLINDRRLTPTDKLVWIYYQSRIDGWHWSVSGTATDLGISRDTIIKANKNLALCGYLHIIQAHDAGRFGRSEYYLIADPASAQDEGGDNEYGNRSQNQNYAPGF